MCFLNLGARGLKARRCFRDVRRTQISAYSTHKDIAVSKIKDGIHIAYAKNGTRSQHVSKRT